ncbi:MAG: S1 domain-containing RNA-binding protein [Clostridium sp.]
MTLQVGSILEGVVVNITNFGAFIEVGGKTGLVHISEISNAYIKDIKKHLKEQDKVKVKVIGVDDSGRMSLSIRQVPADKVSQKPAEIDWEKEKKKVNSLSFEDMMSKFTKDSEEKMHDLKKGQDSKRKGGYSRR